MLRPYRTAQPLYDDFAVAAADDYELWRHFWGADLAANISTRRARRAHFGGSPPHTPICDDSPAADHYLFFCLRFIAMPYAHG